MRSGLGAWCLAGVVVALGGCAGSGDGARATASAGDAGPVSTVDDYRKARFEAAMRGLEVRDGRVAIDREAARGVEVEGVLEAVSRGHELLGENDFSGAVGAFRTAILAEPSVAVGYLGLGDALVCKKKDGMALAAFRTAVDLEPANVPARMRLAETLNRTGDIEGWADELGRVLELDPANGEAHARLAVALYYLGDREGALAEIGLAERHGGVVPGALKANLQH